MIYNFTNFNICLRAKVLGPRNTSLQNDVFFPHKWKAIKEKKGREKLTVKNCNMCILKNCNMCILWLHSCIPILTILSICVIFLMLPSPFPFLLPVIRNVQVLNIMWSRLGSSGKDVPRFPIQSVLEKLIYSYDNCC